MSTISSKKPPARKMGRPTADESIDLDERIKAVALELFIGKGYDAVTMEEIAQVANITKRTLYLRYDGKAELFSAALRKSKEAWTFPAVSTVDAPLEEQLLALGEALLAQALDPRVVKLARMASIQADRFPEALQAEYDIYLSPRTKSVVDTLKRHEKLLNKRIVKDYAVVAELFIGVITGIPARLASYGTFRDPAFERKRIRTAVQLFLNGVLKN